MPTIVEPPIPNTTAHRLTAVTFAERGLHSAIEAIFSKTLDTCGVRRY